MNTTSLHSEYGHHHRRRRSRAEVAELAAGFERSGLNRTEYCRQHGLTFATLKRYSKPVVTRGSDESAETKYVAPAVSLIPIEVVDHGAVRETSPTALFVELREGRRIGVDAGFDAATLRRLIAVLDEV